MENQELSFLSSLYGGYWNQEVTDFRYMTNAYFPPQRWFDSLQARLPELVKAYPSTNWYLSSVLAESMGLSHKEVVVGNGASELISAITSRFVNNLAVHVPTFDEYTNRAQTQGKQVSLFSMPGSFELDIDAFIQHVKSSNSDAALFIRPNNPTGTYVSKAELTHFLDGMPDLNLVLVDESFIEFVDTEASPSALDLIFEYPNLMVVKSLSKNYGIPGLRLGYAVTGDTDRLSALRADLPIWNINSLAQFFLEDMDGYRSDYIESCAKVRDATQSLYRALGTVPYLYPYPTHGNFVLCQLLYGQTSEELTARLFEHSRALINNCGSKHGLDDRFVRIACRTQEENSRLVGALKEIGALVPPAAASDRLVTSP
jgi:histidinol-phosphate/aromatic aminotransferase/cobyric acid decarboxylase-like protein